MQKTIEELYYGDILPSEQLNPQAPEYSKCRKLVFELEQEFVSTLTPNQNKQFEALMIKKIEVISFEAVQAFVDGFKLATKLMVEIFSKDERTE